MALGLKVPSMGSTVSKKTPIKNVYETAATTNAENYDDIMAGYDSLQKRSQSGNTGQQLNYTPLSPTTTSFLPQYSYNRSSDLNNTISGLQNVANTGGYSDSDVANIRERGLSPIRSVYSNARRNLDRQKSLQGGYSPNYGAVLSKMAREQSELGTQASTNINAEVAKMIASGKLSGLQALSPLAANENTQINNTNTNNVNAQRDMELNNAEEVRRVNDTNANMKLQYDQLNNQNRQQNENIELSALSGKQSLFGTTPAMTNMFSQQVLANNQQNLQAATTANQIKNARIGMFGTTGSNNKSGGGLRA